MEPMAGLAVGNATAFISAFIYGHEGWVISDVESPHDSLRMFLAQHRN
jgi:hypothetical protein